MADKTGILKLDILSGAYKKKEVDEVNYSLEEKEIGTWIDGSKIYKKTILFNGNAPGSYLEYGAVNGSLLISLDYVQYLVGSPKLNSFVWEPSISGGKIHLLGKTNAVGSSVIYITVIYKK